jgi:hypothetical protein
LLLNLEFEIRESIGFPDFTLVVCKVKNTDARNQALISPQCCNYRVPFRGVFLSLVPDILSEPDAKTHDSLRGVGAASRRPLFQNSNIPIGVKPLTWAFFERK